MFHRKRLRFSKHHTFTVIGVLDIVRSTALIEPLEASQVDEFCGIFLERAMAVVHKHKGIALKNTGDGLLFYVPIKSSHTPEGFLRALAIGRALLNERDSINAELVGEGLPAVSYRISMSYGPVSALLDGRNQITDLFGVVVSTCSKMNKLAKPNTLVIGEAFHAKVLATSIRTQEVGELTIAPGKSFAVYEVA